MIIWQEYIHLKTRTSIGWFGFFNNTLVYTVGKNHATNFWVLKKIGDDCVFLDFETAHDAMWAAELDFVAGNIILSD